MTVAEAPGIRAKASADGAHIFALLHTPQARIWQLATPHLSILRAKLQLPGRETDIREVTFGSR